jgi:integrase
MGCDRRPRQPSSNGLKHGSKVRGLSSMTVLAITKSDLPDLSAVEDSLETRYMALPVEKRYAIISKTFEDWLLDEPIRFPADHSTFGWSCRVPDCTAVLTATGTDRMCAGHRREFQATSTPMELDEFAAQAAVRTARGDWALRRNDPCRVCGPQRESAGWGYCQSHMNCCRRAMEQGQTEEEWLRRAVPRPAYPICSVPRCVHDGALTCFPGGSGPRICASHYVSWTSHARTNDLVRSADTWSEWVSGPEVSGFKPAEERGILSTSHLPKQLQAEIRYALHRYSKSPRRARWRPLHIQIAVSWLVEAGVTSLSDPRASEMAQCGSQKQSQGILRDLIVAARSLTLTAEDTKEAGWFDPAIVGATQFLQGGRKSTRRKYWDLKGVSQRWLRDLLWDHLRYLALEPAGRKPSAATVHGRIMATRLLSRALRELHGDGSEDPSKLNSFDARAFRELWDLWVREQIPVVEQQSSNPPKLVPLTKRTHSCHPDDMRLLLAFGRDQEILGGWVTSFLKEFPQYGPEKSAPLPRPISDTDYRLMLQEDSLAVLDAADPSNVGLSDIWLTHAYQGGRIGETLTLRLGCIGLIGNAQPYLWRDISKVGVIDYGLPCYLPVYERLQRRQETTRAKLRRRYAKELDALDEIGRAALEDKWDRTMPLFPATMTNPDLELPISNGQFRNVFTSWIGKLGLAGITTHRTRATLATALLNNGAPASLVRQLLGHFSEATLAFYARYDHANLLSNLQRVWTAGPGMQQPGSKLMTPDSAAELGSKAALGERIDLTVIPVEHGLCRYGPVVGGKACPRNKNCSRGPAGPCPHFVLTGADLAYWERKRDAAYHFAEGAPSEEAREYILSEWEPWEAVLAGLRQTLDELGLLRAAEELDLRSPMHDYFHPLFTTGWQLPRSQSQQDHVAT